MCPLYFRYFPLPWEISYFQVNIIDNSGRRRNENHLVLTANCVFFNYRLIPNCVIKAKTVRNRVFIGDQVDDCKDLSGLFYLLAFQKVNIHIKLMMPYMIVTSHLEIFNTYFNNIVPWISVESIYV